MTSCDVAVFGGGPAGASAARLLARQGWGVVLLHKPRLDGSTMVESLPPTIQPLLTELGAWERFRAARPLASAGILSVWGEDAPRNHDFILSPYGCGWHVNRLLFHQALAKCAQDAGCRMCCCDRLLGLEKEPLEAGWTIGYLEEGKPRNLQARFLIDGSGRCCVPARRLGLRRSSTDCLVALTGLFDADQNAQPEDLRLWVEASERGWWYSAPLADARILVAYLSDADLLPSSPAELARRWREELRATQLIQSRLGQADRWPHLSLLPAAASGLDRAVAPAMAAVGDAAWTIDPLSGKGAERAIESSRQAAEAVTRCLRGQSEALQGYQGWIDTQIRQSAIARLQTYRREMRWADSVFWRRRH